MPNSKLTRTYLILLIVPIFWGGAFGTTKHALIELQPLTESALRFLLAAFFMILWSTWKNEWDWTLIKKNTLSLAFLGFTGVFGYNFFFATGLQYTSAITGALVVVVNPVFTALAACVFMGESWNWQTVVGVTLSLFGVLLVITKGSLEVLSTMSIGTGELYLLGGVASWVAYTLMIKKVLRQINASLATTVSTLWGVFMLLAASLVFENQWDKVLYLSNQTILEMIYLALCATVIAFILYNWGIQKIGATKASAYINLMPLNALWIAVLFYNETVSMNHIFGMLLTITGILLTTRSTAAETAKAD